MRPRAPVCPRNLCAALLSLGLAGPALAIDHTWVGGSGDWIVGTNWLPASVPGSGDKAILNSGAATLSVPAAVAALDLGGGALAGTGSLAVAGASVWSSGTMSGTGSTSFAGALAITGAGLKVLVAGRVVDLQGSTTWSGNTGHNNNAIRFWNGATINNSGTFNDANAFDSFIEHNVGGPHHFNNSGTYNKLSNTVTTIDGGGVAFNNTGTVNVNAGTLLPAGGGTSTGTFNIAAGAKLEFREGASTLNNAVTAGAGTLQISTDNVGGDATLTLNGGTHTSAVLISGSTLTGTDHRFQGQASWTGGTISGAATTTFDNTVQITGPNTKTLLAGRILNLQSGATWSGNTANNNNAIRFWNGGTINSYGVFTDANAFDSFIEHSVGSPHNFNNLGTYDKQSNTVTTVDGGVAFNNTGTVNVNAGTMLLAGGTSTGTFNLAAGAKLEFRDGASTLQNATTAGAGTLQVSTDNIGGDAVLTINGGTHTSRVLISGSTLTGTEHRFQGPAAWTGGAIGGAGTTTFDGALAISGANTKSLFSGRVVNLNGTTTWGANTAHGNNAIDFRNGGTINNNGIFNDENTFNSFMSHNQGGPHAFNNTGTFNKQSNTTTLIENFVVFNNTGTVNVNAGTLQLTAAHTNRGLVNIAAGATFLGSNNVFVNAGTVAGNGTLATLAGGDVANAGDIHPGFGIGHLTVDGDLTQQAAGALNFELAGISSFDTLGVLDDVTLAGRIVAWNAGYVPVVGDRFIVLTFDQRLGSSTFASVDTQGYAAGVTFEAIYNLHDVTLVVASVPEPQTWAILLGGLALVAAAVSRRRHPAQCRSL